MYYYRYKEVNFNSKKINSQKFFRKNYFLDIPREVVIKKDKGE